MQDNFEYLPKINYLELLNNKYFYNLPDFSPTVPVRNIILFSEDSENNVGNNILDNTEFCNGTNHIMTDMQNSSDIDLDNAMIEYKRNPNNFKPKILPTCLFRIFEQTDKYSNIAMIGNDTLIVELFFSSIKYTLDVKVDPVASTKIVFPPTEKQNQ